MEEGSWRCVKQDQELGGWCLKKEHFFPMWHQKTPVFAEAFWAGMQHCKGRLTLPCPQF